MKRWQRGIAGDKIDGETGCVWSPDMRLILAIVVAVLPTVALAQDVLPKQVDSKTTIERGLGFLVRDALAWKTRYNCTSCHHAGIVIWSMHEARQFGHPVNE